MGSFSKNGLWLLVGVFVASPALSQAPADSHLPIPPGFDFPAEEATLLKFRDENDVPSMRKHAWMVFAGMTQPAPGGEAIWETWYPSEQTFNQGAAPQAIVHR